MPSKPSARLAALTVAAVCSAASTVVLTTPAHAESVRVHDIQGDTRLSPFAGKQVTDVTGIVTGIRTYGSSRGFWIQDPAPDADPATSEGVFVFTSSTPQGVAVGDEVSVSGTVSEYVPGGTSSGNQSVTEITRPTVTVVSRGNPVPAPAVLDARTVPAAYAPQGDPAANGSVNALPLRPSAYALDLYESLEGMNVRVADARVVGAHRPVHGAVGHGEAPREPQPARRHGLRLVRRAEHRPDPDPVAGQGGRLPDATVGDVLAGATTGPLDYNQYGGYTLVASELGTLRPGGTERETTRAQHRSELAIATYNVENLDPSDDTFAAHAEAIVHSLSSPDIVSLEEIQDNNGATDDGTVAADMTLGKLIDAIEAAGGPRYDWRAVDPADKRDGGEPGGNIRQAFLFNPARVSFTDRPGGDATTATDVVKVRGKAALTLSPGRVAPDSAAFEDSRKPLAGEFVFRGRTVIVIANHFSSKGGDQGLTAQYQPPVRGSETQRHLQAQEVHDFTAKILKAQKNAAVVALGDINDFEFSRTTRIMEGGGVLWSAVKSLSASERYSYVYQGNSQALDQILISPSIRRHCSFSYDSVHINAEFHDQISDHDPQVLRFRP
ncbi:Endonuclease/exonuclease/phosphatase OS=Streptomyces tendae OX=1932 GN=F3L20_23085 PE=4 SV=1 [Streptomyces tendae]